MKSIFLPIYLLGFSAPLPATLTRVLQPVNAGKVFFGNIKCVTTFFNLTIQQPKLHNTLPPDLYTANFGFFCKQELKMQKANIPVTFRLGSMEYTNILEQKNCH